ncbi:MAG TPA: Omp28 family outer membrane lipoprotein [Lentimicrobium sp.]|nr:Omp28 family outer membrane lipoprotein [Lentimicrobium sp.]
MKNIKTFISKPLVAIAFGFFLLNGCDKIDEPYTKKIDIGDTSSVAVKRVLLEDYTGHTCVNCPKAAKIAHDLKETYGDRLVVIAVHAGGFANPTAGGDFTYDFRTTAGTDWDSFFGISNVGNPNGMVNRKGFPGNHILSPSAWAGAIGSALQETPVIDITIENSYTEATRNLSAKVTTTFLSAVDRNLKIAVVLTESGIVKPQRNNDNTIGPVPVISDYEHSHVLRGAISTTWGSVIENSSSTFPSSVDNTFTKSLNAEYVPENCAVVAFVYDDDTKEVLQVAEAEVVQ